MDWLQRPIDGVPKYLAGGWRAALVQVRGDWQFYCELFHVPAWNAAVNMCWMCKASSNIPHLRWVLCNLEAGWRATRRTHESYVAELEAEGRDLPVLLLQAVGLRLECIMIDVLHCVDLGVAAHIVGNVFWELVAAKVWGETTHEGNVAKLNGALEAYYKATKAEHAQLR